MLTSGTPSCTLHAYCVLASDCTRFGGESRTKEAELTSGFHVLCTWQTFKANSLSFGTFPATFLPLEILLSGLSPKLKQKESLLRAMRFTRYQDI